MLGAVATRQWFRTWSEAREKKSLLPRIRGYRGSVEIEYETKDFKVFTARNGAELRKALELRHDVFIEEWQGRRTFHRLDVDDYDFTADHLIIVNKASDEVVGTYRLLSSHFTENFYSASEFHLFPFLSTKTVKLEMGRACIHKDYRNGNTIDLLWKGLTQYIESTGTEVLFGCSSVKTTDAALVSRLYRTLADQDSWRDEHFIRPTAEYQMPGFKPACATALSPAERRLWLPPLLRSYLHAGALVYGTPALDRDFGCVDLLTILDWASLNSRFQSRFKA